MMMRKKKKKCLPSGAHFTLILEEGDHFILHVYYIPAPSQH